MTTLLHVRLVARALERQQYISALSGEPFYHEVDKCTCYGGMPGYPHEPHCGLEPGDAWWVIQALLDDLHETQRLLVNHGPFMVGEDDEPWCLADDHRHDPTIWPCSVIESLATRLGVSVREC